MQTEVFWSGGCYMWQPLVETALYVSWLYRKDIDRFHAWLNSIKDRSAIYNGLGFAAYSDDDMTLTLMLGDHEGGRFNVSSGPIWFDIVFSQKEFHALCKATSPEALDKSEAETEAFIIKEKE